MLNRTWGSPADSLISTAVNHFFHRQRMGDLQFRGLLIFAIRFDFISGEYTKTGGIQRLDT